MTCYPRCNQRHTPPSRRLLICLYRSPPIHTPALYLQRITHPVYEPISATAELSEVRSNKNRDFDGTLVAEEGDKLTRKSQDGTVPHHVPVLKPRAGTFVIISQYGNLKCEWHPDHVPLCPHCRLTIATLLLSPRRLWWLVSLRSVNEPTHTTNPPSQSAISPAKLPRKRCSFLDFPCPAPMSRAYPHRNVTLFSLLAA